MVNIFCIRPKGFNIGNDVIYQGTLAFLQASFGSQVNVISLPATSRYESQAKAGLTPRTVHEINQYGHGVIVGGGNLYENGELQVHLVIPRNFNDAQQVADQFKRSVPVILNLQTADHELSKRLIDFCSGLTYALDGGMQRIAEKMFLLTPRNVEVSAEEKARLIDKGFFNQS